MSLFITALLGLIAMLAVGFIFYGFAFKDLSKDTAKPSTTKLTLSLAAMYVTALAFTILYLNINFASNLPNIIRGLFLGLFVSVPFLAIPLVADSAYLKTKDNLLWLVVMNWIVSFAVLGAVVGLTQ